MKLAVAIATVTALRQAAVTRADCDFGSNYTSYSNISYACSFDVGIGIICNFSETNTFSSGDTNVTTTTNRGNNLAIWKMGDKDSTVQCYSDVSSEFVLTSYPNGSTFGVSTGDFVLGMDSVNNTVADGVPLSSPGLYYIEGGSDEFWINEYGNSDLIKAEGDITDLCEVLGVSNSVAAETTNAITPLKNIVLKTALYTNPAPFVYEENNTWTGYMVDVANLLVEEALKDGYNLTYDIDYENSLFNDNTPNISTSDYGVDYLTCTEEQKQQDPNKCFDFFIGVFQRTTGRQGKVVFLPPALSTHLILLGLKENQDFKSIEDVANKNGTLCIPQLMQLYSGFTTDDSLPLVICDAGDAQQVVCLDKLINGTCDMLVNYNQQAGSALLSYPQKDAIAMYDDITKNVENDEKWLSMPLSPSLGAETTVMMSRWMYNAYKDGEMGRLQEKYFGFKNDYPQLFPEEINITSSVYRNPPHAYQKPDGSWEGIVFDAAANITKTAAKYGIKLNIDVSTKEGDVVSDLPGDLGTPTGSLQTISPDCKEKNVSPCFDMILGDYTINSLRQSGLATFTPPYINNFVTTIKRKDGSFNTIDEANNGGGTVCLWKGSYAENVVGPSVDNPVECDDQDMCYNMVKEGLCDMTVDGHLSALARQVTNPELVETGVVVPNTLGYGAFPMTTSLDPAVQIAIAYFMHDYTDGLDLMAIGDPYMTLTSSSNSTQAGDPYITLTSSSNPTNAPTSSSGVATSTPISATPTKDPTSSAVTVSVRFVQLGALAVLFATLVYMLN
jgi:ABC-type amino acid transport substrate-binding protein